MIPKGTKVRIKSDLEKAWESVPNFSGGDIGNYKKLQGTICEIKEQISFDSEFGECYYLKEDSSGWFLFEFDIIDKKKPYKMKWRLK